LLDLPILSRRLSDVFIFVAETLQASDVSSQEEFHTFADESEDSFHTLKDDSQDEFHTLKGVEELEEDQYSGLGLLSLPTEASPPRNQQRSKFWSENDDFFSPLGIH
jgi:hypothetical protein